MKCLALAVAVCALGACWSSPKPPGLAPIPGLLWISEPQPFRLPRFASTLVADGDSVVVGGARGWIARVALADGRVIRERRIGDASITSLVRLDAGHWLATGTRKARARAWIVDDATFAARPIELPVRGDGTAYATTHALQTPAGIVITGPGLPLAIYDPATWKVRKTLDARVDWMRAVSDGTRLVAQREADIVTFDLATGASQANAHWIEAAHGSLTVRRDYTTKGAAAEVRDGETVKITVPPPVRSLALDDDGKRLFVFGGTALRVYEIASGKQIARYELGPSARDTWPSIAITGRRAVVLAHSVVRVIDLATGAITPDGAPPYGLPAQLVTAGDDVLAVEGSLWRFRAGAIVAARDDRDFNALTMPRGELRRFASLDDKDSDKTFITLHALAGGHVFHRWELPQMTIGGWLGDNGEVVADLIADDRKPAAIVHAADDVSTVVFHDNDAMVDDVDVDGGFALLDLHGQVYVVRIADGSHATPALRVPGCGAYGKAVLEHGGTRALTFDDDTLVAWQRDTGRVIASVRVPGDIGAALFLPGTDDILLDFEEGQLAVWSPQRGEVRAVGFGVPFQEDVSPDGTRLALGFHDGRVALVDFPALRAAMKPVAVTRGEVAATCPAADPFAISPEEATSPNGPDPMDEGGD